MTLFAKLFLLLRTIQYLKARQIVFRFYYIARNFLRSYTRFQYPVYVEKKSISLKLQKTFKINSSYNNNEFTFLNISEKFDSKIDWEFLKHGKLWCYHLNYFEFLHQGDMECGNGLELIRDFMKGVKTNSIGNEPYPTSLRAVNWIKFLTLNRIKESEIDSFLYAQVLRLCDNIEYHLLGNHILENGCAILFASYYFHDETLFKKAEMILKFQLNEQILNDGGHFERSPMYHQILLGRLLDCINLVQNNDLYESSLLELLGRKAELMLGWLSQITFSNGEIPLVNDSAEGIAPESDILFSYAKLLGVGHQSVCLRESGYRKIEQGSYEMLVDVGSIGPEYLPAHGHCDALSFLLYFQKKPIIVDSGISTYEKGDLRMTQRGTSAHNTVQIDCKEQSEIWDSFKVGRRAEINNLIEKKNYISASHDGYKLLGARHAREFIFSDHSINITDAVCSKKEYVCYAYLHFHPNVSVQLHGEVLYVNELKIAFDGASNIVLKEYKFASRFNILTSANVLVASFNRHLKTEINL